MREEPSESLEKVGSDCAPLCACCPTGLALCSRCQFKWCIAGGPTPKRRSSRIGEEQDSLDEAEFGELLDEANQRLHETDILLQGRPSRQRAAAQHDTSEDEDMEQLANPRPQRLGRAGGLASAQSSKFDLVRAETGLMGDLSAQSVH